MPIASAPSKPEAPFDHETYACVFSAEGACAASPLTSEPPLPDAEPLTSEPPLADAVPLTSEAAYWDMDVDPGMDTGMDMDMSAPRP
ncbi:hypothetical protein ACWD6Q_01365 [Streptomyces nigra]|uniref:Uncharacterized protein n=1 Tax=Streptomyces nigra TaxID=1827580 RepID=A0ABZ1IXJ6_9ACTN|nr:MULTISPECIES: hypothetical protein [unclassified Streptomyces]MBQ0999177.1 hypothetical protein [Streptomyces sp. RK62]